MSIFDTGIRPAIDQYLKEKSEQQRDYKEYWSASSAGYCMRKVIFDRLGVPPVPEMEDDINRRTRVFESGHIFHEWVQRITKDAGLSVTQELELIDDELMVKGHIDDLIAFDYGDDKPATHLILYDYKTAHSKSFNYKKQRNEIGHYHKMQLGTYMYMVRTLQQAEVKPSELDSLPTLEEARVMSISKDDLRMHEDQLMWSDELSREIKVYWTTLNKYWEDKKLPPCTCLDHDGGFMGRRTAKGKVYNPYFYNGEPCSTEWYTLNKEKGKLK